MRMISKILTFVLCIFIAFHVNAQKKQQPFEEIDTILNKVILRKEIMGGVTVNTQGWGVLFRKGYNATAFKKNLWEVEFVGVRAKKQVRVNFYGGYYSNANSYVYGKLNKVYVLRGGLGQQYLLNREPYWGGVELRFTYYGGLSMGIAKPIFLYIINQNNYYETTSEKYNPEEHIYYYIYGRAPFIDGIGQTKFYPGVYLKTGLNFEYGEYNTTVKSLEIGAIFDGYVFPIPIMAFQNKHYYFFNLYINLTFGKRYNKF